MGGREIINFRRLGKAPFCMPSACDKMTPPSFGTGTSNLRCRDVHWGTMLPTLVKW